ncbi:cation:proton antiporter domain-containing protein, partial [Lysobacter sp. A3-1-A15]|uniref:cation:proton antiporter domain-containing protein n=2 Tax=Novilysobacter TaxID=3382699 RepID=UPI002EDB83AF
EVKAIALPGAIVQIAVATALGWGLSQLLGWSHGAGIVFGLALSVASTVVLLRALEERRLVETYRGRIAVGWLIVEDLAMVLALVLLPALAEVLRGEGGGMSDVGGALLGTFLKVGGFVAFMLIIGRRV